MFWLGLKYVYKKCQSTDTEYLPDLVMMRGIGMPIIKAKALFILGTVCTVIKQIYRRKFYAGHCGTSVLILIPKEDETGGLKIKASLDNLSRTCFKI